MNNNIILTTIPLEDFKSVMHEIVREELRSEASQLKHEAPSTQEELIKIDSAAKLLGVSKVTIHSWKKKGILPFYRLSNKIYFKKSEVILALQKNKERVNK